MPERPRSRSFGPTVLLGLGGAALAAVAGSRDWSRASGRSGGVEVAAVVKGSDAAPLALALALVALAAWGVVLVVRTRARQVVAVLGALAAAGSLAATVVAFGRARDDAVAAVLAKGAVAAAGPSASLTGWYFTAAAGALVALAGFVVTVVAAPAWPQMGTRYDAPSARADAEPDRPASEQELWRALDDGRDPSV
jgi:uncharacterized membrane protein (TIGR02234 family)